MPDSTTTRRMSPLGVAGMVACCAVWGGNSVAVKAAVPSVPAFGCAGLRFMVSLPMLAAVCVAAGQPWRVERRQWWLVAVHAVFSVAQIGTYNFGTSLSQAGRSSVFINVHPLLVAPLGWAVLGEHLGGRGWLGLGSAALGVAVLLSGPVGVGGSTLGDLIVLGSALIFAAQTIAQKLTFSRIPPATLLLLQTAAAIPIFLGYSALFEGPASYHFTRAAVLGVFYQGLAVSGIAFSTWMLLLQVYPAGQLATFAFLTPMFGVAFGNLIRDEPLTWPLLIGGALVGVGISLAASGGRRPTPQPRMSATSAL